MTPREKRKIQFNLLMKICVKDKKEYFIFFCISHQGNSVFFVSDLKWKCRNHQQVLVQYHRNRHNHCMEEGWQNYLRNRNFLPIDSHPDCKSVLHWFCKWQIQLKCSIPWCKPLCGVLTQKLHPRSQREWLPLRGVTSFWIWLCKGFHWGRHPGWLRKEYPVFQWKYSLCVHGAPGLQEPRVFKNWQSWKTLYWWI